MDMTFNPGLHPPNDHNRPQRWFLFRDRQILVEPVAGDGLRPYVSDISAVEAALLRRQYLGSLDDADCYAAELDAGAQITVV